MLYTLSESFNLVSSGAPTCRLRWSVCVLSLLTDMEPKQATPSPYSGTICSNDHIYRLADYMNHTFGSSAGKVKL